MKYLIKTAFLILIVLACKKNTNNMNIKFHSYGKTEIITLNNTDYNHVRYKLINLLKNSSEILRLFVDTTLVKELKENESLLEFRFNKGTKFKSIILGEETITNLFIPLSGDFIGNIQDPIITIFIENSGEYSEPFRNKNGYSELMKIQDIIKKYLR